MLPIITGTTAPPRTAVLKIPEKEPWCSAIELSASEMTIGHITEVNRPTVGKAITDTFADPNRAPERQNSAPTHAPINTLRLSNSLRSNMPMEHPAVSSPQNQKTSVAPVVCASKPRAG